MCGRYSLSTPIPDIADIFGASTDLGDLEPRFNIAPTDPVPTIVADAGGRRLDTLRWGLVPAWAGSADEVPLMINARAESLEAKPSFRDLLAARRCVVPADGFYEWRAELGRKQPYFVRRRDGRPLALAGLWDVWERAHDRVRSCTIITTDANELLRPLHDRMPAVLGPDGVSRWLDPDSNAFEPLRGLLAPAPDDALEALPVSPRVNRVSEDDPECLSPIGRPIVRADDWYGRPAATAAPDQLGLF